MIEFDEMLKEIVANQKAKDESIKIESKPTEVIMTMPIVISSLKPLKIDETNIKDFTVVKAIKIEDLNVDLIPEKIVSGKLNHIVIGSIRELQNILKELGCLGKDRNLLDVDGNIGTNTNYAIRQFQVKNNLEVDGVPSFYTWSALRQALHLKRNPLPVYGTVVEPLINVVETLCDNINIKVPIIGFLKEGDLVKIQNTTLFNMSGEEWYSIYYGEHGGYVPAKYIRL